MSTKEKIKKVALSLFAQRGFDGTSMSDLAAGVGITKASLYAHYKGKEELFLAVFEDVARDTETLMNRLFEESKEMNVHDKLRHQFVEFIRHYYMNKERHAFWSQLLLLAQPELREKIFKNILTWNETIQEKMEAIFEDAMTLGIIRQDLSSKKVMSFRAMRDGVLMWMGTRPEFNSEWVDAAWSDYWFGLLPREGEGNGK